METDLTREKQVNMEETPESAEHTDVHGHPVPDAHGHENAHEHEHAHGCACCGDGAIVEDKKQQKKQMN